MEHLRVDNATDAWESLFSMLMVQADSGFAQPSRGGIVVGEILNAVVEIANPRKGIVKSDLRGMSQEYALGELLWYLSGTNRTKDIAKYSKFWEMITDDGITANSAYGYRIHHFYGFDQWEFVKQKLTNDPLDRQAVIHIKDATTISSKDVPCTCLLQFQIREHKLYLTVYMRSNDIWKGFPYDVYSFTALQVLMAMELGCDVGTYTHVAGSLHLYKTDYERKT